MKTLSIAGWIVLLLLVAGVLVNLSDIIRYMRLRSM
jgi:hypothetical protein